MRPPAGSLSGEAPPPPQLSPGYKLDRYELLCPIAEGGMASVWIARQTGKHGFRKLVAIKTILPKYASEQKFQEMFLDEARIASRIEHLNVTQILDVGDQFGITYLVMEYVDGDALSKVNRAAQKKEKPIPTGVLLRIMADTCAGLHAAHELRGEDEELMGVVHRDVSPQNVLVTTKGIAKLIDFGIAKARDRLAGDTKVDQVKGKIAYMAPEQALGRALDRRADVWAVGAVLYHLLAGKPPFEGENEIQTLFKLSSGKPPLPLPPSVPVPVAAVVRKTLSHTPESRYATAALLQEAIEKAMVETNLVTTAAQVAAYMADLMGDRAEKRRESIALGLKAADERERLADVLQRNADKTASGSDTGAGSAPGTGRIVTASGASTGVPESEKSSSGTTGHTLGGSAAMAVPTVDMAPVAEARRRGKGKVALVVGGLVLTAAAVAVVLATRNPAPPEPEAPAAAPPPVLAPSASAPAVSASAAAPSASASSAAPAVDAAPAASASAARPQPAWHPPPRWVPPQPPAPAPKPTSTAKQRDNYGF